MHNCTKCSIPCHNGCGNWPDSPQTLVCAQCEPPKTPTKTTSKDTGAGPRSAEGAKEGHVKDLLSDSSESDDDGLDNAAAVANSRKRDPFERFHLPEPNSKKRKSVSGGSAQPGSEDPVGPVEQKEGAISKSGSEVIDLVASDKASGTAAERKYGNLEVRTLLQSAETLLLCLQLILFSVYGCRQKHDVECLFVGDLRD